MAQKKITRANPISSFPVMQLSVAKSEIVKTEAYPRVSTDAFYVTGAGNNPIIAPGNNVGINTRRSERAPRHYALPCMRPNPILSRLNSVIVALGMAIIADSARKRLSRK